MRSQSFFYWKIIFATSATASSMNHAEENNMYEREISERGLNKFCDYMEFTGNNLMMNPCNMTKKISKFLLNSLGRKIHKNQL